MTGARIMTTLLNGLQNGDKSYGLETMCVGGGQGMAMIVETPLIRRCLCTLAAACARSCELGRVLSPLVRARQVP